MSFCQRCGNEVSVGDAYCTRCGLDLRPVQAIPARAPVQDEKQKGLERVRTAFLLYAIGAGLSFIPIVGGVGGLVIFIGIIFLVLGLRALGRSSLQGAPEYKSAGRWIIYGFVTAIAIAVVASIAIIAYIISAAFASASATGTITSTSFLNSQAFLSAITDFFVLGAVLAAIYFIIWFRVGQAIRVLAAELSKPNLRTATWFLFFLGPLVGVIDVAVSATALETGVSTYAGAMSGNFALLPVPFTGITGIFFLAGSYLVSGLEAVGAYLGYRATKDVLGSSSTSG